MAWSRKGWATIGVAVVCAVAIGRGHALAQEAPSQPAPPLTWAAKITASLKLDAVQQAGLEDYMSATADKSAQTPGVSADQFRAMTMPERQDYMTRRIALDLEISKARSKTVHRFYALLSTDQRKQFDAATAPPGGNGLLATVVDQPEADKPNYHLPSHTDPDWLIKPSSEIIARVYPTPALTKQLSGTVMLTCTADVDGYLLDCVVASEAPQGLGFGNAALEMSAYLRMTPAANFGVPVRSTVTVPIRFTTAQ